MGYPTPTVISPIPDKQPTSVWLSLGSSHGFKQQSLYLVS